MTNEPGGLFTTSQHLSESRLECEKLRMDLGMLQAQLGFRIQDADKMRNRLRRIATILYDFSCQHEDIRSDCPDCKIRELVEPWRVAT